MLWLYLVSATHFVILYSITETPMREDYNSMTGMMTPSKSCVVSGLINSTSSFITTTTTTRSKGCSDHSSDTPMIDKRKPRKRKLFVEDSPFSRTRSPPCIDSRSRSLERLDASILRVAEIELQKLNSSEESKPKVCTKLCLRYNSDSCIAGANTLAGDNGFVTNNSRDQTALTKGNMPFTTVSKENVTRYVDETPKTWQQINTPLRAPLHISTSNPIRPSTSVRAVSRPVDSVSARVFFPTTSLTVPSFKTIVPRELIPSSGNGSSIEAKKISGVTHCKIDPQAKPPKKISLTSFDPKKLIPIKRSDLRISLTPVNPIRFDNNNGSPGFAILTRIPTPIVSPGDTFKAVKVGNTLQLVPIKNETATLNSDNDRQINNGNNVNGS